MEYKINNGELTPHSNCGHRGAQFHELNRMCPKLSLTFLCQRSLKTLAKIQRINDMTKKYVEKIAMLYAFNKVQYVGKWEGYSVWSVSTGDNDEYTGYPQYILTTKNSWRWVKDSEESISILNSIHSSTSK